MPSAETAYLFRHALLRDAAYQLQLPGDRARLHGLCVRILLGLVLRPGSSGLSEEATLPAAGPYAAEIAGHCRLARGGQVDAELLEAERFFLVLGARFAQASHDQASARRLWLLAEEISETHKQGECRASAGTAAIELGELEDADRLYREALVQVAARGNSLGVARVTGAMAILSERRGRVEQAEQEFKRAAELSLEAGDAESAAALRGSLAKLYVETGRNEDAEREYRQALAYFERHGGPHEAEVRQNQALLWMRTARGMEARAAMETALALATQRGETRQAAQILGNLGVLDLQEGRHAEAEVRLEAALTSHREAGDKLFEGITLTNLAAASQKRGLTEKAAFRFEQALQRLRETGAIRYEASAMGLKAGLLRGIGRMQEAADLFAEALDKSRSVRDRHREGLLLVQLALCLVPLQRETEARDSWASGEIILRELGDTAALERCIGLMREVCARAGVEALGSHALHGSRGTT